MTPLYAGDPRPIGTYRAGRTMTAHRTGANR